MRDIFVLLVVFGSIPFIFQRPHIGIYVWSWLGYMNFHRLSWGFATTMPFAQVIAIVTLAAFIFSKEPKKFPWTRESVTIVIFLLWMAVTTIFAEYRDLAWDQYVKVLKIQFMTFLTFYLITDRKRIDTLIWVIVVSLGFYGVKGGIFTITSGGGYHVQGPLGTFIGGNNEIGLALVITVPLMRYLQMRSDRWWVKWGLGVAIALTIVAILGTQSRGALVGILAMTLLLILKSRKRFALLILITTVGSLAYTFMPQSWHDRMQTIQTFDEDASAMGRINAWHMAFNLATQRPTGGGFETFRVGMFERYAPEPNNVHDAHSIYFEVLGEHGFIGLAIFLSLFFFAWRTGASIIKSAKDSSDHIWARDLASMLQVSFIGYLACGAFLGLAYFDLIYHLIAIMAIIKLVIDNKFQPVDAK